MPKDFENTIAEFIKAGDLLGSCGRVLVAVSGGADSLALMSVLNSLKAAGIIRVDLIVGHVNHQLRGRLADEDEAFVVRQAGDLGLPVLTRQVAVAEFAAKSKLSVETAARQMRIDALAAMANEMNCSHVATAHHKNDNVETMIHRLLRGAGYRGLAGIRPVKRFENGITFVRPLLCVGRDQIFSYLKQSKITWRHDHTNDEQAFTRNFIRHSLLPALQSKSQSSLVDLLDRLSCSCRRYVNVLERDVGRVWPQLVLKMESEKIELDKKVFSSAAMPLKPEIVRRALVSIGSGERDLTQEHYEQIVRFAQTGGAGKTLSLPQGFVFRGGGSLIFEKRVAALSPSSLPWKLEMQIFDAAVCDIQKFKSEKTRYVEWFDADKIVGKPVVRPRKNGDLFWPIGLAAPKKIGKFLTDSRIDSELRKTACVVEDDEKIIWLVPFRASEKTKVTSDTKRILQITCRSSKDVTP
jgi:tRNA(Ile)-lysidine synthase